jgi:outer membrane protein assembly factor BamB
MLRLWNCHITKAILWVSLAISPSPSSEAQDPSGWPQWGGPYRNFTSPAKGLANSWPEKGPRQLWSRTLGEGYSGITVDSGKLYTMYRAPVRLWQTSKVGQEVIIAMDANTGKTLWEQHYDAPFEPGMKMENGPGPHVTPLVVGNRVFSIGVTGKFYCQDKNTGKILWYHDLIQDYGTPARDRGYSCSPVAYNETVIIPVGGRGQAVMAFNQKDGSVVWKKHDFSSSPSSPLLINLDGQDQLVVFMGDLIAGLDPKNGELLWSHPHKTDWGLNISTPVWSQGNLLFCTSAYSGGSRMLQLSRQGGQTSVKELWFTNRMRIHIGNAVRVGDYVYGSSGDFGPAFFSAVDVKTGRVAWQDRSLSKASFIYADGKFILVDEDGNLALATVSPAGLKIHSKVALLSSNAWTGPTLVGTTLYLRDRKNIMALDVGVSR